jgi:ABC-type lipoprotein export system ATPase subunit
MGRHKPYIVYCRSLGRQAARLDSVRTPVASLSGGQRQSVAIARGDVEF